MKCHYCNAEGAALPHIDADGIGWAGNCDSEDCIADAENDAYRQRWARMPRPERRPDRQAANVYSQKKIK